MPTQMLDFGYPQTMIQNQIYALPPMGVVLITCTDGVSTFEDANDVAFTIPHAIGVAGTGGLTVARAFIRVTNQNALVGVAKNA